MRRVFTIKGKQAVRLSELQGLKLHQPPCGLPYLEVSFLGWMKKGKPIRGSEGYNVDYYFDNDGNYLGPDDDGIEPMWEDE